MEGWSPALSAAVGAVGFAAITGVVLFVLLLIDNAAVDPSWALPVFVTAVAAGGAAGLTMKNLNLKRAESRRDTNLMFDSQFETGARLLGGNSESEIIAGSALLSSLLRESPRHAQACADLLCAALRVPRTAEMDEDKFEHLSDVGDEDFARELGTTHRIRNAITSSIAKAISRQGAPDHLNDVRWEFDGARFGDKTNLSDGVFGCGTAFLRCTSSGEVVLDGSEFVEHCYFEKNQFLGELSLRGVKSPEDLVFYECSMRGERAALDLRSVAVAGVDIRSCLVEGTIELDLAHMNGDLWILDSEVEDLMMFDGKWVNAVRFEGLTVTGDLRLHGANVRKYVLVSKCAIGGTLELSEIRADGEISVRDSTYREIVRKEPTGE